MVHGAWCMVHGAWCMVHGARCTVHSAWCMVHGAWCMVHGARCMVHGAWCMVHGAWGGVHGACVYYACRRCAAIVRHAGLGEGGLRRAHALVGVAALEGRAVAELRRVAQSHGDRRAPLLRTHARSDARRLGHGHHVERLQRGRGGRVGGRCAEAGPPSFGFGASTRLHPPAHPMSLPFHVEGRHLVRLHAQHELVRRVDAHHAVVRLRLEAHLSRTVCGRGRAGVGAGVRAGVGAGEGGCGGGCGGGCNTGARCMRRRRTRSSHSRSSRPLPALSRKGTPRHRSLSTQSTHAAKVGQREPAGTW
jgi:hypothetical protein